MICSVCGEEMTTFIGVDLALNIGDESDDLSGAQGSWWLCECGHREKIEEEGDNSKSELSWSHWSDPDESGGGA